MIKKESNYFPVAIPGSEGGSNFICLTTTAEGHNI